LLSSVIRAIIPSEKFNNTVLILLYVDIGGWLVNLRPMAATLFFPSFSVIYLSLIMTGFPSKHVGPHLMQILSVKSWIVSVFDTHSVGVGSCITHWVTNTEYKTLKKQQNYILQVCKFKNITGKLQLLQYEVADACGHSYKNWAVYQKGQIPQPFINGCNFCSQILLNSGVVGRTISVLSLTVLQPSSILVNCGRLVLYKQLLSVYSFLKIKQVYRKTYAVKKCVSWAFVNFKCKIKCKREYITQI
jgi:hypothetical protein